MINIRKYNNISEKSNNIPIPKKQNLFSVENKISRDQYSETEHFFDPSKQSPPNEFITKLKMRITNYHSLDRK
jgi:hypothetical protein